MIFVVCKMCFFCFLVNFSKINRKNLYLNFARLVRHFNLIVSNI